MPVWTELTALGARLRDTPAWPDAVAVAHETMRRARTNVERLAELLPRHGFQFYDPDVVLVPPAADIRDQLDAVEAAIGPLPLALRCWYELVGQVNLAGTHPAWDFEFTDGLVVEAPVDYILLEHETWAADHGSEWDRGPFTIDLAPDALHKADVSGGPPYAMALPDNGVDALFLWEPHQTTFVNYLRVSFRFAGLPGWDAAALDGATKPNVRRPPALAEIAATLLPI
ncbi:MAG TPA: hypothetical protein VH352_23795 [Pseudonocardiaceae bacterium]|nr:hypothetical protein [Pseudonocardiaceae bacterium]